MIDNQGHTIEVGDLVWYDRPKYALSSELCGNLLCVVTVANGSGPVYDNNRQRLAVQHQLSGQVFYPTTDNLTKVI